jgi:hypothetical protein
MGALIDFGNPWIPFVGGILVGGFIAPPVMEAIGAITGNVSGPDSDVAYAYHAFKHQHPGGMMGHGHRMHGRHHRMGGIGQQGMHHHGMGGETMRYHGMGGMHHGFAAPGMPHPGTFGHLHPSLPLKHKDFEKGYTNVEQTYTNHINIRH